MRLSLKKNIVKVDFCAFNDKKFDGEKIFILWLHNKRGKEKIREL